MTTIQSPKSAPAGIRHIFGPCPVVCILAAAWLVPFPAPARAEDKNNKLEIAFEERVRSDIWNNATDMNDLFDDARRQVRFRTRLSFSVPASRHVDMFFGLANEGIKKAGSPFAYDEIYFDAAYIHVKKFFAKGLDLQFGRYEIERGEGFILHDGTPGDGPRNDYFNAAVLGYSFRKSKLEFIGILDPARERLLPVANNQHRLLQNWSEQAVGAYFTDRSNPRTSVDAYYFLKKEVHDVRPVTDPLCQPDRHVHTAGGSVVEKFGPNWNWKAEFSRQWGAQHGGTGLRAWGGYSHVERVFDQPWRPSLKFGYVALSGDDPRTKGVIENWDPLFSQWPKWGQSYVFSYSKESGMAYWTNLGMTYLEGTLRPRDHTIVRVAWYHMDARHSYPGNPLYFATGTHRGNSFQARADFDIKSNYKFYVRYENHRPGDFYTGKSPAYYLQIQFSWQFSFRPFEKRTGTP